MNRRECLVSAVSAATLTGASKAFAFQEKDNDVDLYKDVDVQIEYGIRIPMRDGVKLDATLYRPKKQKKPRPAVFALTPYIAEREHPYAISVARYGYPFLSIDVRGRGNSEGEFAPFFNDPNDGHDVVEWISKQPYCSGKVGARGISYVGFTQWAAVRGGAKQLATIVPSAPCWVGLDYPIRNNIFYTFLAPWMMLTMGNTRQDAIYGDSEYWKKEYVSFLESGRPFKDIDKFFGYDSGYFDEWIEHPHRDDYWDRANPTPEQLADLTMPVLSLTGAYDGDQPGTLEYYRQHQKYAGRKANHYLVIGPWDHAKVRKPTQKVLDVEFGPDSVVDMEKLHGEWFAWTMEGGPKPDFLKRNVAYYVTDAEKWRYADTLDEATDRFDPLYLQSTRNPSDVFSSGSLSRVTPAGDAEPDHYVYDPRDLSGPRLESEQPDSVALKGQALIVSHIGEKLIYHSAPFDEDIEVTGFFKLTAWISIDQADTDFNVSIYDIAPDGSSLYLTEENFRARYREGLRVEKLIETKDPLRYDFDRFFFVSRRIRKGHRLRMVLRPNHSLGWQKNYNSGKPVAEETMDDARTVTVRVYHDAAHPSVLFVPIGRPEA